MERLTDLGKDRTVLGVMGFLVTRAALIFVDISCVGAYFGIILSLLYLTFLKDCLEILIFAVAKFSTRLKWLCRIFKIQEFLYTETNELDNAEINELDNTEANELESNLQRNLDESTSVKTNPCLMKNSLDLVASSSCNSGSQDNSHSFCYSQAKSASEVEGGNGSSLVIFESPRSSKSGSQETIPRKLSYQSTQVVSSTENFTINETNFEDVELTYETNELDSNTSREDLSIKQSPSKWSISKMKFFDSFRKSKLPSSVNVKSQMGNLAAKVTEILPREDDDNDKLISDKNDSPEQVGCCSYLPHFLRSKYPVTSIASYTRF